MKLLVNISSIGPRPTGLGVYALRCARAVEARLGAEVVAAAGVEGFDNVVLRAPASHALGSGRGAALRRFLWSKRQRRSPGDVVYSPTHHGFGGGGGAQLLTVHDLIPLRFPRQHPTQYLFFRHALPGELARSIGVFTVSETTKADIHEAYKVPLDRIWVVPNGIDRSIFHPPATTAPRESFLLAVGAGIAHKNIHELLEHAALWRDRYRLVVVSCRGSYRRMLQRIAAERGVQDRVELIEYAPLDALVSLYQRCAAFIYPSRWEGFGIPPLEALACGARVIVSDIPAHREVLGSAARFVKLGDRADWARALAELEQPQPSAAGGALQHAPLERFTWERSAELLVQHLTAIEPRLLRPRARTFAAQ